MRILVTGSNGQLGSEIRDLVDSYQKFDFIFKDLPELDICNFEEIHGFIINNKINSVINCAAYTAVDEAEKEGGIATNVNCEGVLNIINALEEVNGKLIHISTDYVFDGNSVLPYQETDKVNPQGMYGLTKRKGELVVIKSDIDAIVIRTSWLYSAYGNNFVKTMLRLGKEKDEIGVIFDQVGSPTNASDLARVCLDILLISGRDRISKKGKVYHFSNEGVASWYDFAIDIFKLVGEKCRVEPIQTKDYPTLAKRPHYSVMDKSKIKTDFKIKIPYWRDSLEDCVCKIKRKS